MAVDSKDHVKKVNSAVGSLKNKVDLYANVTNLNSNKLKGPLKGLVHASAPGKKLTRLGWAVFWFPEPTMISHAVGLPMIVGGKLLERHYTGTTLKHVGLEAAKTLKSLEEFLK